MTEAQVIRRVVKPVLWLAGLAPLGYLVWAFLTDHLEAEPVKGLEHFTGRTAIIILFITLAVTPFRRLTGLNGAIKVRRLIGNFSFFYALVHFGIFLYFDLELSFGQLTHEVIKRPWITVGFAALLILATLAATSPQAVLRWLGGKRWQRIHRAVYVAAVLGIVHFLWSQKKDISLPVKYAVVLGVLLLARLVPKGDGRRKKGAGSGERGAATA